MKCIGYSFRLIGFETVSKGRSLCRGHSLHASGQRRIPSYRRSPFLFDEGVGVMNLVMKNQETSHISVCIPTYKRPNMLGRCLEALQGQEGIGFTYSIVVVDNDVNQSARKVVQKYQQRSPVSFFYDVEPIQNIALTRNRAVQCAKGNFIAFIDDDEFPCDNWLINLYSFCRKYNVDGVLGPVKPLFTSDAPSWLKRSRICERPSHMNGTVLNHLQTRTGNVLIKYSILEGEDAPFPPEMGRTGGEDIEFFKRMIARGRVFVWCEEAVVYENIPPDRYRRLYYIEKSMRIGGLTGEMLKNGGLEKWKCLLRSVCAAVIYTISAVRGLLIGQYVFMKSSMKLTYHLSRIAGCFGFVPIRERRDR